MQSVTVDFQLRLPSRRQLQTSSASQLSNTLEQQLRTAVAAALGVGEEHVLISTASAVSTDRVVQVSIINLTKLATTPSEIVRLASASTFTSSLESRLGTSVTMAEAPALAIRVTSVPSPPPSTPPATPPPPSSPTLTAIAGANSLSTNALTSSGVSATGAALSEEMLWVIIVGAMVLIVIVGCVVAFCMGKRATRKTMQVGRPAIRRQVTPEEVDARREARISSPQRRPSLDQDVRLDDVRLIELGMQVERTLARSQSGGSSPRLAQQQSGEANAPVNRSIRFQLEGVQAAIDDVRESISPRGQETPIALATRDTRIYTVDDVQGSI